MQCGGLMKVTIELRAGGDHHDPFKEDIDKNLEAMERAIKGKMISGDDVLLRDTASILNGIKMRLTSNPRTAFNNWSSQDANSVTFEPLVMLRPLRELKERYDELLKEFDNYLQTGDGNDNRISAYHGLIDIIKLDIIKEVCRIVSAT
jgi:hypothetical protein